MSKSKYSYFFPENLKYKEMLNNEDMPLIAGITGYKKYTIAAMLNGHRKLPDSVKDKCEQFAEINKKKLLNQTL